MVTRSFFRYAAMKINTCFSQPFSQPRGCYRALNTCVFRVWITDMQICVYKLPLLKNSSQEHVLRNACRYLCETFITEPEFHQTNRYTSKYGVFKRTISLGTHKSADEYRCAILRKTKLLECSNYVTLQKNISYLEKCGERFFWNIKDLIASAGSE